MPAEFVDESERDDPAWRFALALYGREGVPAECLRLQDGFGVDVSLMLVCLWLGAERGIALSAADLAAAAAVAAPWKGAVVERLRTVRRDLKGSPEIGRPAVARLRKAVQSLEIEAERIEIAILRDWAEEALSGRARDPDAGSRNLALVAEAHGAGALPLPCLRAALEPGCR